MEETIHRINGIITGQSEVILLQREIIDELFKLLLMHVSADDLKSLTIKIREAAKKQKEVEDSE